MKGFSTVIAVLVIALVIIIAGQIISDEKFPHLGRYINDDNEPITKEHVDADTNAPEITQNENPQPSSTGAIRMATMWLENTDEQYTRKMIKEMDEAGANTIAIGVHGDGMLFFETDAYQGNKLDLLPVIIDETHSRGMKVYAWTDTLNFPELKGYYGWNWTACYVNGKFESPSKCGFYIRVSPFSNNISDFVRNYYSDLASYDIDGIQFQDDLFLAPGEDVSHAAQLAFREYFGYDFDPSSQDSWQHMQIMKTRRVTDLVKIAVEASKSVNPDIKFAFDITPETDIDSTEFKWAVDVDSIVNAGVDYIGIMSFHRQTMKESGLNIQESIGYLNLAYKSLESRIGRERVIYRFWTTTFDEAHKPLKEDELDHVIEYMKLSGAKHIGYIPHYSFMSEYKTLEKWK